LNLELGLVSVWAQASAPGESKIDAAVRAQREAFLDQRPRQRHVLSPDCCFSQREIDDIPLGMAATKRT
jgi:hypothetical protein